LLLLRATVGLAATAQGVAYLYGSASPAFGIWFLGIALIAGGAALVGGFLTPLAGFLVSLCFSGIAVSWFPAPPTGLHDARLLAPDLIAMAVALVLLGPGAFSIDGRLFGRREIVIPPSSRPAE
jgi:uncharacterized membrane protein YphA (DoxX/SURF4 family)